MQVINTETGKVETLILTDPNTGKNHVEEFVHIHFGDTDFIRELDAAGNRTGRYMANTHTINWWKKRIYEQLEIDEAIDELEKDLSFILKPDEVRDIIIDVIDCVGGFELSEVYPTAMQEIKNIREEYGI